MSLNDIQKSLKIKYGTFDDEFVEQTLCCKYINSTDKILELGGNIGRVSMILSKILNDSKNLVVLETDTDNFQKLNENKELNNLSFRTINSALSIQQLYQIGWNSYTEEELIKKRIQKQNATSINIINYDTIENICNIKFNTLVIDCEGAFYHIIRDFEYILNNINKIIIENDFKNVEHKMYVKNVLLKYGFVSVEKIDLDDKFKMYHPEPSIQEGFYEVFIKNYKSKPKIAFCFLIIDEINQLDLWKRFFQNAPDDLYTIQIHCKYPDKFNDDFFNQYKLKETVDTKWGVIEEATALLYKQALNDKQVEYVLPISESTVPLYSFEHIYNYLFENKNENYKSYIKYWKNPYDNDFKKLKYLYKMRNMNKLFLENIKFAHYYKTHSWFILNRRHAEIVVNDKEYIHYFKNHLASSENYTMYLLSLHNEYDNITCIQITAEDWSNPIEVQNKLYNSLGRSPRTIGQITIDEFQKYIKNKNFLFGRKFSKDSNVGTFIKV